MKLFNNLILIAALSSAAVSGVAAQNTRGAAASADEHRMLKVDEYDLNRAVQNAIAQMTAMINNVDAKLTSQISAVDSKVNAVTTKAEMITAEMTAKTAQMNAADAKATSAMITIDAKVDSVTTKANLNAAAIAANNKAIATNDAKLFGIAPGTTVVDKIKADISAHDTKTNPHANSIGEFVAELTSIQYPKWGSSSFSFKSDAEEEVMPLTEEELPEEEEPP